MGRSRPPKQEVVNQALTNTPFGVSGRPSPREISREIHIYNCEHAVCPRREEVTVMPKL